MKRYLQQQWQEGGWLAQALRPLALLTSAAVALKHLAYRRGWKQASRLDVPIVVVGNLYVGGTGKTPFILAAVAALRERGWHPGVISRGYGTQAGAAPKVGQGSLDARIFGDEPALIARQSGAPVAVHPLRVLAAQALRRQHPQVDVILSDDGLQHLALARDVEIVIQDSRGIGNGLLLPAGPLREPVKRLGSIDALVTNRTGATTSATADGSGPARRVDMELRARTAWRLVDGLERPLADLALSGRVAAVAGIGHPERFFATLRQAGVHPVVTVPLPDHYDYAKSPFSGLDAQYILITDKDAVKCLELNDPRLWAVSVSAHLSDPFFFDWLDTLLHGRTPA